MGFLRRPKATFKRKSTDTKKIASCSEISGSDRTYETIDLEENLSLSDHSLDECFHVCQGTKDILDLSERSGFSHRQIHETRPNAVSFRDEELGLTPRHVVTEIHYRPRTSEEEKDELYYNSQDFRIFEQEDMFEKIEKEIQDIESMKKNSQYGLVVTKVVDEKRIKELMRKAELEFWPDKDSKHCQKVKSSEQK